MEVCEVGRNVWRGCIEGIGTGLIDRLRDDDESSEMRDHEIDITKVYMYYMSYTYSCYYYHRRDTPENFPRYDCELHFAGWRGVGGTLKHDIKTSRLLGAISLTRKHTQNIDSFLLLRTVLGDFVRIILSSSLSSWSPLGEAVDM